MTKYDYDLFVIRCGSGAVRASLMAALAGAKVALAEDWTMGCAGVVILTDRAVLEDAHTWLLMNSGKGVRAEKVLVATGIGPAGEMGASDVIAGADLCSAADEAFGLKEVGKRILIAGGGDVAVE